MWAPPRVRHSLTRAKLLTTLRHTSPGISLTTSETIAFNSWMLLGLFMYTLSLAYPHKKKSGGFKSGECDAQMLLVWCEMTRSSNFRRSHSCLIDRMCCCTVLLEPLLISEHLHINNNLNSHLDLQLHPKPTAIETLILSIDRRVAQSTALICLAFVHILSNDNEN